MKQKVFLLLIFSILFLGASHFVPVPVQAISESDCLNKSVSELSPDDMNECINVILPRIAAAYAPAQERNKTELSNLKKQLDSLNKRILAISGELKKLELDIKVREENLKQVQKTFESKVAAQYKFSRLYDPIAPFLFSDNAVNAFREFSFRQKAAESDRVAIEEYANNLATLKNDKTSLEKNKVSLAALQKKVSEDAKFLEGEVNKVDNFLSGISAKQQAILDAKSGSFITSVGDVELADDYNASIKGFRDSAPSGSFAVFSFGGYTHRKGMSQYGARGRAQNGQNTTQILKAYYGKEPVSKDTSGNIIANGVSMNFEDYYLMGIAEMPSSWHQEALRAQAIAARTYAYRYKLEGKPICITQSCQVFSSSKANNPPDAWKQAVQSTRGQVLEDVVTYYSSTAGGYSNTSGWDTTDSAGGGSFVDRAFEKLGGSPWFYKAWYRKGYTSTGAVCGDSNPWLNNEEFTDIVNAAIVLKTGSDSRVTPLSPGCSGDNPYSYSELVSKGGVSSVSSVVVSQGNGITNNVTINGSVVLTGEEFKKAFNLRAPGYLRIPQGVGFGSSSEFAFFNIEKK